jgi:tetratricopeptide (TPR) repeat protein
MLKYTMEGVSDPARQKVYYKLITSVFELTDTLHEALKLKYSPGYENEKKRVSIKLKASGSGNLMKDIGDIYSHINIASKTDNNVSPASEVKPESIDEKEATRDKVLTEKIKRIFYLVWLSNKLSQEEIQSLNALLQYPLLPLHLRTFMVSSVMLSQLRFYDQGKFGILIDLSSWGAPEISQRALAGLLINLHKYDSRLEFYPEVKAQLKILFGNPAIRRNAETLIKQFIRSKGTEKLQQRIRDEFLPGIVQISTNLRDKIGLDKLMEEGLTEDGNPDWQNLFKDSPGIIKKMEEFSEMQMKGDDVLIGSFSMLKSFPFFDEAANWFMPFFPQNPDIERISDPEDRQIGQLVNAVDKSPLLCNSDKYSFCFSIMKLPQENIRMISQAIEAEMEQFKELTADEELLNPEQKQEFVSNQYIQDLYRFYKLFARKADFEDIFGWKMEFHNIQSLSDLFTEDPLMILNIAEYYLSREYFEEAAGIFSSLPEHEKTGDICQKLGWCYQKTGDFHSALNHYLKAELFGNSTVWTLKKIALCYRNLKKPDKALEYYQAAEKEDTENLGVQLNIGHCLLELNRYEEALKCYFKVEYLSPGNSKVWRPIGWCSFITGNKAQAEKYFMKLMDDQPGRHDYLSMGHVQWSLGHRRSALEYYLKSMAGKGFTEDEFLGIFEEDLPHLLNQGIDKDDIPIMLDQLRYQQQEEKQT